MNQYDLLIDDKIYFKTDKKPYSVKASNDEFTICTKPFNLKQTCLYTIIDWKQRKRNRNNMVFNPYDYMIQDNIDQCLTDLTNPEHVCKISHRGIVDLDIMKVVRGRKVIFE